MATLAHFAFLTADGNHPPPVLDEAHATSFHTSLMEEEPERFFVLNTVPYSIICVPRRLAPWLTYFTALRRPCAYLHHYTLTLN